MKEVACLCMAFPQHETNVFYAGGEDGSIFQSQLHGTSSSDHKTLLLQGHFGPVTSLDIHPISESYYSDIANNLIASCAADWTVKIWNPKYSKEALVSLEAYQEYVCDVKWNPTHPSLLGVSDGEGNLDIWNLGTSFESPDIRVNLGSNALNRIAWGKSGQRLAAGDSKGLVSVFSLDKEYVNGKIDDWNRLEKVLNREFS